MLCSEWVIAHPTDIKRQDQELKYNSSKQHTKPRKKTGVLPNIRYEYTVNAVSMSVPELYCHIQVWHVVLVAMPALRTGSRPCSEQ